MKNCLVTGSAGFIGYHLANKLIRDGYNVVKCDMEYGLDIDRISLKDLVEQRIDTVFHLAAFTDALESIENPDSYFENNVVKTIKLMDECVKYRGIKKFIFASSAAVYGNTDTVNEEGKNMNPRTPYAASKLTIEGYLKAYAFSYDISYIALRYFNVYGPYNTKGIVYKLIDSFLNNKPIKIYNNGYDTRDFIHVDDVVRATIAAANSDWSNMSVNVGTGVGTRIVDLYKLLVDMLVPETKNSLYQEFVWDKRGSNGITSSRSIAKTEMMEKCTGFKSSISLEDGLKQTLTESVNDKSPLVL